ncbi:diguanylate cyclase [Novimethylophilus kurashikiensis]|uniref:Diguanylate cyclase n=1 Tax=Novimethylophilus kurashikiensis TaxID=1825523 RepID=A0A2R5F8H8_9PROT|nr:glyoxalase superfamily protein [Novimethylophilus kurashikiensis]GBG14526.1 diguanylate cyclase [Novimethylophilus kurashikiensis]
MLNHPNVSALKDQANRLIAYLGDKHRIKLKLSSALEAIAAIHQQRDWNTLRAWASDEGAPTIAPDEFELVWDANGACLQAAASQDFFRHSMVYGTAEQTREWLVRHVGQAIERGFGGLFLNLGLAYSIIPVGLQDKLISVDLGDSTGQAEFNLLRDLSAEEVVELLTTLHLNPGNGNFWVSLVNAFLKNMVERELEAGVPLTLPAVCDLLERMGRGVEQPSELLDPPVLAEFEALGPRAQASIQALILKRAEELRRFRAMAGFKQLFSASPSAQSYVHQLNSTTPLLIDLAFQGDEAMMRHQAALLLSGLTFAMQRKMSGAGVLKRPHVLGTHNIQYMLNPTIGRLIERARSAKWSILATAPREGVLINDTVGELVLGNTWHKIYFDGLDANAKSRVIEQLNASTVIMTPDGFH